MITVGGIDIGGTKCAVSIGKANDGNVEILAKKKITTPKDPKEAVSAMVGILKELVDDTGVTLNAIGISCGSPLDSQNGIIKEPPNLPGCRRKSSDKEASEAQRLPHRHFGWRHSPLFYSAV